MWENRGGQKSGLRGIWQSAGQSFLGTIPRHFQPEVSGGFLRLHRSQLELSQEGGDRDHVIRIPLSSCLWAPWPFSRPLGHHPCAWVGPLQLPKPDNLMGNASSYSGPRPAPSPITQTGNPEWQVPIRSPQQDVSVC